MIRRSLCAALLALIGASSAGAHMRYDVRVEINPPKLTDVVIELHQDALEPQIVAATQGKAVLEVLNDEGRVFLRIGNGRTEADVAAAAFHRSRISGGAAAPKGTLSDKPRWRVVNKEASYGWFDSHIAVSALEVPPGLKAASRNSGQQLPFGEWRIPLKVSGKAAQLSGFFIYLPPGKGLVRSRLTSPAQPAPGLRVEIAPGAVPAILLSNRSKQTVAVLDSKGQPFIRIGPKGVSADTSNPDWPATATISAVRGQGWQRLSQSPSHVWLEPRAAYSGKPPADPGKPQTLNVWAVDLTLGGKPLKLDGINEWQPGPKPLISGK